MKRTIYLLGLLLISSCATSVTDPYSATLCALRVSAQYPDGFTPRAGAVIRVENINLGSDYALETDADGTVSTKVPEGLYRISVSDRSGKDIFNGMKDNVRVTSDTQLNVELRHSKAGSIVIKEIYCGGCTKAPEQGTYAVDKYIILHNNDASVQYLDSLCFGTLAPYNSNSNNPFLIVDPASGESSLPDFLPIIQAVWQFGGSGSSFPIKPGEDAVLCIYGAIDHSARYPESVNLNRKGYFVCYNPKDFNNPSYHPAPGTNIEQERYLDLVLKMGQANAYTFSINSPAVVFFRMPEELSVRQYIRQPDAIVQIPGSSVDRVLKVKPEWVVDAVEVFNGSSTTNTKRIPTTLDAGYVSLSRTYLGHSLMRRTDEAASLSSGYEVLQDTNNSSEDLYESEIQSLHE